MNRNLIAALLVVATAAVAAPAFASNGYGPAPSYNPLVGAPASQRGQSAQTLAAEQTTYSENGSAYGGVASALSNAGRRAQSVSGQALFAHR
ncbi:hypothetical protein [Paraburkholderia kirstenboschensis]|jgi:hypothetical protein|uniref:DUF4148 domain-containing protein n=1 Tax=Paraburkholderia kirstenboschensis TaxID=1245436 RepID=A0ABZ0E8W7_9BURK|nr:hypothetical protein [Paraburkholderia kirstenboschensis]WOD13677.1 hypothetical protein RW095_06775 [Paraburkholderia kirstenboschensis]